LAGTLLIMTLTAKKAMKAMPLKGAARLVVMTLPCSR
jgi:hypothetical protein